MDRGGEGGGVAGAAPLRPAREGLPAPMPTGGGSPRPAGTFPDCRRACPGGGPASGGRWLAGPSVSLAHSWSVSAPEKAPAAIGRRSCSASRGGHEWAPPSPRKPSRSRSAPAWSRCSAAPSGGSSLLHVRRQAGARPSPAWPPAWAGVPSPSGEGGGIFSGSAVAAGQPAPGGGRARTWRTFTDVLGRAWLRFLHLGWGGVSGGSLSSRERVFTSWRVKVCPQFPIKPGGFPYFWGEVSGDSLSSRGRVPTSWRMRARPPFPIKPEGFPYFWGGGFPETVFRRGSEFLHLGE